MKFKLPADKSKLSMMLMLVLAILAVVLMVAKVYILVPIVLFAVVGIIFLFGYLPYDDEISDNQ
jgi:Flp pilus assembly protein TadB